MKRGSFLHNLNLHLDLLIGIVPCIPGLADDLVCHFHTGDDFTKDRIFLVEKGCVSHTDEKLGACAVGLADLAMERVPLLWGLLLNSAFTVWPGPPVPCFRSIGVLRVWIASLNHEIWDHPVEKGSIIKSFFSTAR